MARMSALQLAVPGLEVLLDRLRPALPDGATVLNPPHVSLGYPWLPANAAVVVVDEVAARVAHLGPIEVLFTGPHRFPPDRRGRTTVVLRPVPEDPIRALVAAVADIAGSDPTGFTPHCSLFRIPAGVDPTPMEALVAPDLPLAARLDHLDLRVQGPGGNGSGWRHHRTLQLDQAGPGD